MCGFDSHTSNDLTFFIAEGKEWIVLYDNGMYDAGGHLMMPF